MSIHRLVPAVEITGLSNSGTTTNAGAWNTVDLDSVTTVPSGATAALVIVSNDAAGRWIGARTTGKTTAIGMDDASGDAQFTFAIPLGAGNTIDLYVEDISQSNFYLVGFFSSDWTWFDIDGPLPAFSATGGSPALVTAPVQVPAGVETIFMNVSGQNWSPVGETEEATVLGGTTAMLMQLNGSNQVRLQATAGATVLGYLNSGAGGVEWVTPWMTSPESITADATVRAGSSSNVDAAFVFLHVEGHSGSQGFTARAGGDSVVEILAANTEQSSRLIPLSASGTYEYQAEATFLGTVYALAWISEPSEGQDYAITAAQGTYTYTGQAATLIAGDQMTAEFGTYSLLGSEGQVDIEMNADLGEYDLTGQVTRLLYPKTVAAVRGSYQLIGQNAALDYSGGTPASAFIEIQRASKRGPGGFRGFPRFGRF